MAEIDDAAKAHGIKHGEIFSIDVANNMPYLQACLQEAIRCHPAVGMNLGRIAPPQGVEIDGTYIPGGVRLFSILCMRSFVATDMTPCLDRRWSKRMGRPPR